MENITLDDVCQQYYNKIYRFCLRRMEGDPHRADELTSEVFYLLVLKWDRLYKTSPLGILTWLYRVARLKLMELNKKQQELPDAFPQVVELFEEPDLWEELKKYDRYLHLIREQLSAKERALFDQKVVEQRSYAELAHSMGISEHAAQLRWYRLQVKLEKLLDGILN